MFGIFLQLAMANPPCDRVGGTVKMLIAGASLQGPDTDQVLSAKDMLQFCEDLIN